MSSELQEKLKNMGQPSPVDDVVKTMLISQAKSCVRARVKLMQMEKEAENKSSLPVEY